jgi:protein-L-isoaspartate(D-aspartate) O-methyltransferase
MMGRDDAIATARADMVDRQIAGGGISDPVVLAAMRVVPREAFVPEELAEFAYADSPLPIEAGQTISQPYIVARMIELAEVGPGDRVLEVGGSGYAAAVLSRIAAHVVAVERHAILANAAQHRLATLGYDNVTVYHRDGTEGLSQEAPFDALIVSAGGRQVPEALLSQLVIGGRLVIPVGPRHRQILKRLVRRGEKAFEEEDHGIVAFVPLIAGEAGVPAAEPEAGELDGAPILLHRSAALPLARARPSEQPSVAQGTRIVSAAFTGSGQVRSKQASQVFLAFGNQILVRYLAHKSALFGVSWIGSALGSSARVRLRPAIVSRLAWQALSDWLNSHVVRREVLSSLEAEGRHELLPMSDVSG